MKKETTFHWYKEEDEIVPETPPNVMSGACALPIPLVTAGAGRPWIDSYTDSFITKKWPSFEDFPLFQNEAQIKRNNHKYRNTKSGKRHLNLSNQ